VSIIINYGASKTAFLRSATQFVACDLSGVNARKYILREPLKLRAERQSLSNSRQIIAAQGVNLREEDLYA